MPEDAIRDNGEKGSNRRVYFHLPTVTAQLIERAKQNSKPGEDPVVVDAGRREAIARAEKREAEAERAQSENEQRKNTLLPRDLVHAFHFRVSESLRKLGERFARKSTLEGMEAQRQLNSVLEGYGRELRGLLQQGE